MLALQPRVVDAVFCAIEAYLPIRPGDDHSLGCHRPRVPDRQCFCRSPRPPGDRVLVGRGRSVVRHLGVNVAAPSRRMAGDRGLLRAGDRGPGRLRQRSSAFVWRTWRSTGPSTRRPPAGEHRSQLH